MRVVGDLRVTRRDDIKHGYPVGILKNVILSSDVLVAFAGNVPHATHTLRNLPSSPGEPDEVLPQLLKSCQAAGPEASGVDYLVAARGSGLSRVKHTGIETGLTKAWIGDIKAFELYQRAYHEIPVSQPIQLEGISPDPLPSVDPVELEGSMRMANAIGSFLFGSSVESVGEAFLSATCSVSVGFTYEVEAYLAADHEQVIESGKWVTADWGTVAEGGFGYSTLVPVNSGIGTVGLYFPHAGLGLLYHPLLRDAPFVYRGMTHEQFRVGVKSEHGVDIDGPRFN